MRAALARAPTQPGGSVEKDKRRETGPLLAIGRIAVLRFYVEDWLGDEPGWHLAWAKPVISQQGRKLNEESCAAMPVIFRRLL